MNSDGPAVTSVLLACLVIKLYRFKKVSNLSNRTGATVLSFPVAAAYPVAGPAPKSDV